VRRFFSYASRNYLGGCQPIRGNASLENIPEFIERVEALLVVYQISLQLKKTMLIKSPIIVSCMTTFLEKHRVLRCKRLIRVRKSRFLRSICQVFSLPMNSFRAGKQRRYAPHSSQNHCFTRMPARFNKRRSFLNVSSVRGPRTKAIIWPVSRSMAYQVHRCCFLEPTKDQNSSTSALFMHTFTRFLRLFR